MATPGGAGVTAIPDNNGQEQPRKLESAVTDIPDINGQEPPPKLDSEVTAIKDTQVQPPNPETAVYLHMDLPNDVVENQSCCSSGCKRFFWNAYISTVGSIPCCPCVNKRKCFRKLKEEEEEKEEEEGKLTDREIKVRRNLKFHFMSPFQKWRFKNKGKCLTRYPFTLSFQIMAVCLVTTQVWYYGTSRAAMVRFFESNKVAINSLFLDFDSKDTMMVYSMDDLYHLIQRIADTYYGIQTMAVAPYGYAENNIASNKADPPLLHVMVEQNDEWGFDASTHDVHLSLGLHTIDIPLYSGKNGSCNHPDNCTVHSQLQPKLNASSIGSVKTVSLHFQLTNFFIDPQLDKYMSCVIFDIKILFNNAPMSGAILVTSTTQPSIQDCNASQKSSLISDTVFWHYILLDAFVLIAVLLSFGMSFFSFCNDIWLACNTYSFFKQHYNKWLTCSHVMSLQNFWLASVVLCNLLIGAGTILHILILCKMSVLSVDMVDSTALILGLGVFHLWCGLLYFLSFFDKFNILLLTLRVAFPFAIRLFLCTGILYVAFTLLGWLVLGPYHPKFGDPSITSECLFTLLNGDDMYKTFQDMSKTSLSLLIFSKIYLYLYIGIFVCVVLGLFGGIYNDAYETVKQKKSMPNGFLLEFAQNGTKNFKNILVPVVRNESDDTERCSGEDNDGGNSEDGEERGSRENSSGAAGHNSSPTSGNDYSQSQRTSLPEEKDSLTTPLLNQARIKI